MIFDYFFLKFYKGILKSSAPEFPRFMASLFLGCLVILDILHIDSLLAKLDIMPSILDKTSILIGSIVISTFFFKDTTTLDLKQLDSDLLHLSLNQRREN